MDTSIWYYENKPFTKELAQEWIAKDFIGFIYLITDLSNDKKYIGKKLLVGKRKMAPLKGQKRKRTKIVESDWEKYYGSSELVQSLVLERKEDFKREILYFCKSKGELMYQETKEQFDREVLLSDDYYNNFVSCKINGNMIKSIRESLRK